MSELARKFLLYLFIGIIVCSLGCVSYLAAKVPNAITYFLPIPFLFLIMGVILNLVLEHSRHVDDKRLVTIYLALKVAKFLLIIIMLFAYAFLLKMYAVKMFFMIGVFYITYLIYETGYFFKFEKSLKNEKDGKRKHF